jgi:iron-sulfur cluster assembly accessory protein
MLFICSRRFCKQSSQILYLSEACKERLKEICTDNCYLRITVEGGGCSGFQYKFGLDPKRNAEDFVFGDDIASVIVDDISLGYISGSTVDFHKELIRSGFRIVNNPKMEQGCSCGASFSIKLD